MDKYINTFLTEVPWAFEQRDITAARLISPVETTAEFRAVFPRLSELLTQAVRIEINVKSRGTFWLLCWECRDTLRGWLCLPPEMEIGDEIAPAHKVFLSVIGGIDESFGKGEEANYLSNMNCVMCLKNTETDLGYCKEYFDECCAAEQKMPHLDFENLLVVAEEANGNMIICNKISEEILLFAHDHDFDYVEVYDDCPAYTFYRIPGSPLLQSWIETIAGQWQC